MSNEALVKLYCWDCNITFGITESSNVSWQKYRKAFHCPNGHINSFPKTEDGSEVEQLKTDIAELKKKLACRDIELAAATKRIEELTLELEIWSPSKEASSSIP
jgi:hypothetical protein